MQKLFDWFRSNSIRMIRLSVIAALILSISSGCAFAKRADGEIIWGVEMGTLTETANEGITTAVNTFIPGLGTLIAGSLVATGGVTGTVAGIGAAIRRRQAERAAAEAERKRKRADQEREEARVEAARMTERDAIRSAVSG